MTLPENLTFACPACDCRLTVPLSFAGVIGPCPHCNTQIQAPSLPPGHAAAPPAPAPPQPPPVAGPAYSPPPQPQQQAHAPPQQPVHPAAPELESHAQVDPRHGYKPEPRQLPQRQEGREPVGKRMSESMRSQDEEVLGSPRHAPWLRMLLPVLFVLVAGAVVFILVMVISGSKQPPDVKPIATTTTLTGSKDASAGPAGGSLPPSVPVHDETAPVVPPGNPGAVETVAAPDISSQLETKPAPAVAASKVLEKFLTAKTLAERLPLIEKDEKTTDADLQVPCLTGPLPPIDELASSDLRENRLENYVDFYFVVRFRGPGTRVDSYQMLVRQRGDQDPKVVVEPYLDLYGGRLQKFASKPTDQPTVVRAWVFIAHSGTDKDVPNSENKFAVKLGTDENRKEILTAYIGHNSNIGEKIAAQTALMGNVGPCTLTLVWNTTEAPAHPYVEAMMLKPLTWSR